MVPVVQRLGHRALLLARHARSIAIPNASGGFSYPGPRSLEQIVKLELLESEQAPDIRRIWEEFHADKGDAVATTLNASEFQTIVSRAQAAPYFLFPVYRQEGFFNMMCQFQQSCFLVTYLEAFKKNPSTAPPCVAVSLYDNLLVTKKLALIRAEVINLLTTKEAQHLLVQLLTSYQDDKLYDHVYKFNNKPDQFDFEVCRSMLIKVVT